MKTLKGKVTQGGEMLLPGAKELEAFLKMELRNRTGARQ